MSCAIAGRFITQFPTAIRYLPCSPARRRWFFGCGGSAIAKICTVCTMCSSPSNSSFDSREGGLWSDRSQVGGHIVNDCGTCQPEEYHGVHGSPIRWRAGFIHMLDRGTFLCSDLGVVMVGWWNSVRTHRSSGRNRTVSQERPAARPDGAVPNTNGPFFISLNANATSTVEVMAKKVQVMLIEN